CRRAAVAALVSAGACRAAGIAGRACPAVVKLLVEPRAEPAMAPNDGRIATGDWALLGLLSVLWGGSFCFNGVVLKELPPLTVVFVRVVLASLMLLPLLRYKGLSFPSDLSGWTPFVAMALFNNVLPFGLILTA